MCLFHIWYYLFGYCILHGNWVPDGYDDCIICTTNWFIQIFLGFWKCLDCKDFILKNTNLLVQTKWQSRKQSTLFIISTSNLVVLTCSILSAKSDPLFCVNLIFWKEINKCFLYFFFKTLFLTMLEILSTPLTCVWNELPSAQYQRAVHSWQQNCHRIGTWKVYTDNPRVGSWNRMQPIFVATF